MAHPVESFSIYIKSNVGRFLGYPVDPGLGLNPSGEEEIDLNQVLVLTLVQNIVTIKKVRSQNVSEATNLVMWSVILHLSLKGQSRRQSPKTDPCQSTRRTNTRKRNQKTKKSQREHHSESPPYTVLLKIDKNENRDAVLFENHGRETTTILKYSASNFKTFDKMFAFQIVSTVEVFPTKAGIGRQLHNYYSEVACYLLHICKEYKLYFSYSGCHEKF